MHYCITPSRTAHQIAENRDDPAADTALAASVLEVLSDGTERSQTKLRDACKELGHKGRNADMHAVFLRMAENPDCPVKLRLTGSRGQNYLYRIDPEREPV
jgi:formamidopyrimidine-DNA glycosylase